MKTYINNFIPRLKEFSLSLDKKEIFVDIPWVIVDEKLNQEKYIFRRNGDLVMSLNGQATIGKWEYISAARSLLIDRTTDKILLNQNFIDTGVMILKKDGFMNDNLILVNEIIIPDLDVATYLHNLYYEKNRVAVRRLKNGLILEVHNYDGVIGYNRVTIEGESVPDGVLEFEGSVRKYVIKDRKIIKLIVNEEYITDKGNVIVEQKSIYGVSIGDLVFRNNLPAPDGKYKLGFMNSFIVMNGRIIK